MRSNRRPCHLWLFALLLGWVCAVAPLSAADKIRPRPEWGVTIGNVVARLAVLWSLEEASRWLTSERCQALLTEFHDERRQPLADRLTVLGTDIQSYLRMIRFVEGSSYRSCKGAAAFTEPGSRVVYICDSAFQRIWQSDRMWAAAIVLHEALHSLGLGENPPTSDQITKRVLARCTAG